MEPKQLERRQMMTLPKQDFEDMLERAAVLTSPQHSALVPQHSVLSTQSYFPWVPGGCRPQPCADASTRRIGPVPRSSCANGYMAAAGCCRVWWRGDRQKLH